MSGDRLELDRDALRAQIAALEKEIQQRQETEDSLAQMVADLTAQVAALREENARLTYEIMGLQESQRHYKEEANSLRAQVAALVEACEPFVRDGYCDPMDPDVIALRILLAETP